MWGATEYRPRGRWASGIDFRKILPGQRTHLRNISDTLLSLITAILVYLVLFSKRKKLKYLGFSYDYIPGRESGDTFSTSFQNTCLWLRQAVSSTNLNCEWVELGEWWWCFWVFSESGSHQVLQFHPVGALPRISAPQDLWHWHLAR